MSDIILHHYELSPFSEKIRRILAYKKLPWSAVEQPVMMPKPDLLPLTGGNRRIPAMQIGADVYCDTALIARRLEQLHPAPTILPPALAGAIAAIEDWADHRLFMFAVPPTLVGLFDVLPDGFVEDRKAMSPGFSREALEGAAPHALSQALQQFDELDRQLNHTPYLLGDTFTLADAAVYHPLRFMQNNPDLVGDIDARPALAAWANRIADFGAGEVTDMSAADALATAREAEPTDVAGASVPDAPVAPGTVVDVVADDYGPEKSRGRVVRYLENEIVILREDESLGEIAVHFPRAGYLVSPV